MCVSRNFDQQMYVKAVLTGGQLESCPLQSFYFYVNIVARRLEQVPAGNLSEEHSDMQSRNASFICREL